MVIKIKFEYTSVTAVTLEAGIGSLDVKKPLTKDNEWLSITSTRN